MKKDKRMTSVSAIINSNFSYNWAQNYIHNLEGTDNNLALALNLDQNSTISMNNSGPIDLKPDASQLNSGGSSSMGGDHFSPPQPSPNSPSNSYGSSIGGGHHPPVSLLGGGGGGMQNKSGGASTAALAYPPNHPLSGSKHLCSICGDRASGKHYGVYSCEGCKGFFKRTVRKDLSYACREDKNCIIDKRQRNRCQYCRYQKCLAMGMKREAVQEERQRTKDRDSSEVESTSNIQTDIPIERIVEAEKRVESVEPPIPIDNTLSNLRHATDKQLYQLVEWAKLIPHFTSLPLSDQVLLLRAGWNELLIAAFSHRSMEVPDGIVLSTGLVVNKNTANTVGVGSIYERVLSELVHKMREMNMDKTELGCLRAIILYNPDVRGIKSVHKVEMLREKIYGILEEYTRSTHPHEPGRFAKLLLRLPALRSIGLKCLEHLFFFKIIGDFTIDTFLMEMLDNSTDVNLV